MHVFEKCGVLNRNYGETYMDSKQEVINGVYLELRRMGKMANRRKQDEHLFVKELCGNQVLEIWNFKILAAFLSDICSVGDAITLLQAKLQQKYML